MSKRQVKPGDVVQLTSDGPPMTVESVEGEKVACVWFHPAATCSDPLSIEGSMIVWQSQQRRETFSEACLILREDPDDDDWMVRSD